MITMAELMLMPDREETRKMSAHQRHVQRAKLADLRRKHKIETCMKKRQYQTAKAAYEAFSTLPKRFEGTQVYECDQCACWHIGRVLHENQLVKASQAAEALIDAQVPRYLGKVIRNHD